MDRQKMLTAFWEIYNRNSNIEEALLAIRNSGAHLVDSVVTVRNALKLSIPEADSIVLNSSVWSNRKDDTILLREAMHRAMLLMANEDESATVENDGEKVQISFQL